MQVSYCVYRMFEAVRMLVGLVFFGLHRQGLGFREFTNITPPCSCGSATGQGWGMTYIIFMHRLRVIKVQICKTEVL